MVQAASHQADKKELQGAVHKERLLQAEDSGNKEFMPAKSGLVVARSPSFRDGRGLSGRLPH